MDHWFGFVALGLALLGTSCASYKVPTGSFAQARSGERAAEYNAVEQRALEHPLYFAIPRHRSQVRLYDMPRWIHWGVLGNDDDGIFGEGQRVPYSTNIHAGTFVRWWMRNSLHNFCFYVVGSAQWKRHYHAVLFSIGNGRVRILSRGEKGVFDSDNSFKIAFNDFKPFIALQFAHFKNRRFQFYVGWRDRGNLGFKLRPWAKATSRGKQPKKGMGESREPQGSGADRQQADPNASAVGSFVEPLPRSGRALLDLAPEFPDFNARFVGTGRDVVQSDQPIPRHETAVEFEILFDAGVGMIAIDKEKIDRATAEQLLNFDGGIR